MKGEGIVTVLIVVVILVVGYMIYSNYMNAPTAMAAAPSGPIHPNGTPCNISGTVSNIRGTYQNDVCVPTTTAPVIVGQDPTGFTSTGRRGGVRIVGSQISNS